MPMTKEQAIQLWNGCRGTSFGGDWGGDLQINAFGGAALVQGVSFLYQGKYEPEITMHKQAAKFLRDWADALDPPAIQEQPFLGAYKLGFPQEGDEKAADAGYGSANPYGEP